MYTELLSSIEEMLSKALEEVKTNPESGLLHLQRQIGWLIQNAGSSEDRERELHQTANCIVRILGQSRNLSLLLQQLLESPQSRKDLVHKSYPHVNGFGKYVLLSGDEKNNWKLRLHVWRAKANRDFYEEPHDHRWVLATYLVQGKYYSYILEEVDEKTFETMSPEKKAKLEKFKKKLYAPVNLNNRGYKPKSDGEVKLEIVESKVKIEEGQSCVFPIRMMHRVLQFPASSYIEENESMCVTLMLTLPPESGLCRLMVTKHEDARTVGTFKIEEIEDEFTKIRSHLQGRQQ